MDTKLSIFLSIVGCITGCASLFINFYKFLSERFKLEILFAPKSSFFFDKLETSRCLTNYHGVIAINFVNKSSQPVTIYGINSFIKGENLKFDKYNGQNIELITEVFSKERYTTISISMKKQLELPLRLGPYDSFECIIFFPFFPDVNENSAKMDLYIQTTKGKLKTYCYLEKIETIIHNH